MDIVGPFPRTKQGNKYLLTLMDYASKYPEAIPLKRVDAKTVVDSLLQVFSQVGIPEEILTDQGSYFMSNLMSELFKLLGVKHLRTAPYHPQMDRMLVRFHGTLKAMLRKCKDVKRE